MAGGSILATASFWQRILRRSEYKGEDGVRTVIPGRDVPKVEKTESVVAMLSIIACVSGNKKGRLLKFQEIDSDTRSGRL